MKRLVKVFIWCDGNNPNGAPDNDNRPRQLPDGRGLITDVCIKSKMRLHWKQTKKLEVFGEHHTVVSPKEISSAKSAKAGKLSADDLKKKYIDLCFGALITKDSTFAAKKNKKDAAETDQESSAETIGIRGVVQVSDFKTIDPIEIIEITETPFPSKRYVTTGLYVGNIYINDESESVKLTEQNFEMLLSAVKEMFTEDKSRNRQSVEVVAYYAYEQENSSRWLWAKEAIRAEKAEGDSTTGYKIVVDENKVPAGAKQISKHLNMAEESLICARGVE